MNQKKKCLKKDQLEKVKPEIEPGFVEPELTISCIQTLKMIFKSINSQQTISSSFISLLPNPLIDIG
jgi:hypothetical protein